MNFKHFLRTTVTVLCFSIGSYAQNSGYGKKLIQQHFEQAQRYNDIALYGESIGELNKAIKLADKFGYEKEIIHGNILKAEIFRKTEDFDRGIELLYQLKSTKRYPKLHVQKLSRLAALYAEHGALSRSVTQDSIDVFTQEALEIAVRLNLKAEEAGLRNEIGFAQNRAREFEVALKNLNKSADLYSQVGDKRNELGVQTNILDLYVSMNNFKKCDSLYPILVERIKNKPWYSDKSKLYKIISMRYHGDTTIQRYHRDTIQHLIWADKAHGATADQTKLINSNQMASFKVIHDTEHFKDEALKKANALERQRNQSQRLLLYVAILVLILVIIVLVFVREKRLKWKLDATVSDLNVMNDKYQLLMVESNHRIKNNLQMIISMLEFTKKGLKESDSEIIQNMSGKIQTISALHKHLYIDIHNEFVDLNNYYNEILKHYTNIGFKYKVNTSIQSVQIRSERIVYFGLILNEMLANTLEHGRSEKDHVELKVELIDGEYYFLYSDDSAHFPKNGTGTGTMLIKQLVNRINGSNYEMFQANGTYKFQFRAD